MRGLPALLLLLASAALAEPNATPNLLAALPEPSRWQAASNENTQARWVLASNADGSRLEVSGSNDGSGTPVRRITVTYRGARLDDAAVHEVAAALAGLTANCFGLTLASALHLQDWLSGEAAAWHSTGPLEASQSIGGADFSLHIAAEGDGGATLAVDSSYNLFIRPENSCQL